MKLETHGNNVSFLLIPVAAVVVLRTGITVYASARESTRGGGFTAMLCAPRATMVVRAGGCGGYGGIRSRGEVGARLLDFGSSPRVI